MVLEIVDQHQLAHNNRFPLEFEAAPLLIGLSYHCLSLFFFK